MKTFFLVLIFFAVGLLESVLLSHLAHQEDARAAVSDNVSGYAWSENVGWASFNCTNTATCGTSNYGVRVDSATGNFSGYAWSETIGWIKFDLVGPYPGDPNYSARLDFGNNQVSGWARACAGAANPDCTGGTNPNSGGWDGWISMRGTNYGVSWNSSTTELSGWAWGSEVIGWISFNCQDTGVCASSNYKVIVNVDKIPPSGPTGLLSASHTLSVWSNDPTVDVSWQAATDSQSGLDGYSFVWGTSSTTIPDAVKDIEESVTANTSPSLSNGSSHYFHIRAVDNAVNWGSVVHLGPFWIDTTAPSGPTGLGSSSHTISTWSSDRTVDVSWVAATDTHSGLDGYSYIWDTNATTVPDAVKDIEENATTNTSPFLGDGSSHYFHIRPRDNVGNWGSAVHLGPFWVETIAPSGSILINSNASYTNSISVTLTLSCVDSASGCSKMKFSNDNVSFTPEENYTTSKSWTLASSDGPKTVYVQFKDGVGNWSSSFNDSITLDTARPQVTALSASSPIPQGGSTTISWTVIDSGGSNLKQVEVWRAQFVNGTCDDSTKSGCAWSLQSTHTAPPGTSSWLSSATNSPPNGTWWYGLHVEDNATNQATESDPPAVGPKKVIVNSPPSPGSSANLNSISTSSADPAENPGTGICARKTTLSWTYSDSDGNPQSQARVQVDESSQGNFATPIEDITLGAVTSVVLTHGSDAGIADARIPFNGSWVWRVQVQDSQGAWSNWVQDDTSFTTILHDLPIANFTFMPSNPSAKEPIQFTGTSQAFGGAVITSKAWQFLPDGNPSTSTLQNPVVTFPKTGFKPVILNITDSDNLSCTIDTQSILGNDPRRINIKPPLPKFFPVVPF